MQNNQTIFCNAVSTSSAINLKLCPLCYYNFQLCQTHVAGETNQVRESIKNIKYVKKKKNNNNNIHSILLVGFNPNMEANKAATENTSYLHFEKHPQQQFVLVLDSTNMLHCYVGRPTYY